MKEGTVYEFTITCPFCGHSQTVTAVGVVWVTQGLMTLRLTDIPYVAHDCRGPSGG